MTRNRSFHAFLLLLTIAQVDVCFADTRAATAYAVPLQDMVIDGNVDDWPAGMIHHPVINNGRVYGPGDLDDDDLTNSEDLTAWFMVGYDLDKQMIYLAAVVRDDVHAVANGDWNTDVMEIYFEGRHKEGRDKVISGNFAAMQYAGIAGDARYSYRENPQIYGALIGNTPIEFAYSRKGNFTIYEWALQPYDEFPGKPTKLEVGKRIGFDVVIVDKDAHPREAPAWICWGPTAGGKFLDAAMLGDLVLIDSAQSLVQLEGTVTRAGAGKPYSGLILEAYSNEVPAGFAVTDGKGRYRLALPPGTYTLEPAPDQPCERIDPAVIVLVKGKAVQRDLQIKPLQLPQPLELALQNYIQMKSYQDKTLIKITEARGGAPREFTAVLSMKLAKPNRIHLSLDGEGVVGNTIISDGESMGLFDGDVALTGPIEAPEAVTPIHLLWHMAASDTYGPLLTILREDRLNYHNGGTGGPVGLLAGASLVHRLLMHSDPRRELLLSVSQINQLDDELVDGEPAAVIELTKIVPFATNGMIRWGSGMAEPNFMRIWVRKKDHLIIKVDFQLDEAEVVHGINVPNQQRNVVTFTTTHQDVRMNPTFAPDAFVLPE